jgi:hypothetical protein
MRLMVTVCAWCERYLGPRDAPVTHGICAACTARQRWHDHPVLVVSRPREALIPVLRHLLQGSPEVKIVLERRQDERRQSDFVPGPGVERRTGSDRRRRGDLLLI